MASRKKPLVLLILDGWGYREDVNNNAIAQANTPVMDKLWQTCPHSLISGSGLDVGLPDGQMGNSEVGHVNLGSGRVVYQDFTRITKAIADGNFFTNAVLVDAVTAAKQQQKAVHIMGLLSPGGVHSHEDHLLAMIKLAEQQSAGPIYLHAFLDGRDTPPRSARASLEKIATHFATTGSGKIASVVGRYYAMDRDKRWDRVEKAYNLLTQGEADYTA
ncbi:MAG TPA: 2,3-bisphosphoglycerate-independent phosphoglycerate mutase, partial [Rheinheimera sp.]|nr:2,3-bisphosphoglycerate-independent phosphoglycerate mutase [Rheinheimera sp.]